MTKYLVRDTEGFRQALAQGINPLDIGIDRPDPEHQATMAERARCQQIIGLVGMDNEEDVALCGALIESGKSADKVGMELFQQMQSDTRAASPGSTSGKEVADAIAARWH